MLNGKELGAAIAAAIQLKIDSGAARSKAEIARAFEIKPPSLHDWEKKGSVDKAKLPKLWKYFSDVVGPEHWGLTDLEWPSGLSGSGVHAGHTTEQPMTWPFELVDEEKMRQLKRANALKLEGAILLAAAQLGIDVKKD